MNMGKGQLWPPSMAEIRREPAGPDLYINGEPYEPLFYFGNTEWPGHETHVPREIGMAAGQGFHLFTIMLHFPVVPEGVPRDYSQMDTAMERVLAADPDAWILPRIPLTPADLDWWETNAPNDLMRYEDGSTSIPSIASEEWLRQATAALNAGMEYVLGNIRYAPHIIGFHLAYNNTGEWFYMQYPEKGIDYSACNRRGFIRWLRETYGTVEELEGKTGIRLRQLDDMVIPVIPDNLPGAGSASVFLEDSERAVQLFYTYINELSRQRIRDLARFVKWKTNGRSLVMIFYGYLFELPDPKSGHGFLEELLDDGCVDMLASPISYADRSENGVMAFMAPVDSIREHGILWMIEDDTRTFLARDRSEPDASFNPTIADKADTFAVHERNMAAATVHGAGLWWMDLWGSGWLEDTDIWEHNRRLADAYTRQRKRNKSFLPQVAFVIDEKSPLWLRNPRKHAFQLAYLANRSLYRLGASTGVYTLRDAAAGRLPGSVRLVVFLNWLHAEARDVQGILEHLAKDGRCLFYGYGPDAHQGLYTDELAGMHLEAAPEPSATRMYFEGVKFGEEEPVYPRLEVQDAGAVPLAWYADGKVGAAYTRRETYTTCFSGAMELCLPLLRRAAAEAGVHLFTDRDMPCTATDGLVCVTVPWEVSLPLFFPKGSKVRDALSGHSYTLQSDGSRSYVLLNGKGRRTFLLEYEPDSK